MLCLMIRRKEQENMANLTFCPQDVHSPFTNCGEQEEKCNVAKRFTVDIFTERYHTYRKWSVNPLVTLVFMYLRQKDVLPDSKLEKL